MPGFYGAALAGRLAHHATACHADTGALVVGLTQSASDAFAIAGVWRLLGGLDAGPSSKQPFQPMEM